MSKAISALAAALACAAAITACGGGGSGTGGNTNTGGDGTGASGGAGTGATGGTAPNVTLDQACDQLATAECDGLAQCSPAALTQSYGGDKALCTSRHKAACVAAYSLPGVTATPSDVAKCAQATSSTDCVGYFAAAPVAACDFKGSKENGSACANNRECKSGACLGLGSSGCGICSPQPAEGAACIPSQGCGRLGCTSDGHCHEYALLGESCDDSTFPCNGAYRCDATKKCVPWGAAGASCTNGLDCNFYQQLSCSSSTHECVDGTAVPTGSSCNDKFCTSSYCTAVNSSPVCVAFLADGDICDGSQRCEPPARCIAQKCRVELPTCN